MKAQSHFVMMTTAVVTLAVVLLGGCTKKNVTVSLPEPVRDTVPVVVPPPAPEPIDSSAIIAAMLRDALQNIYFDLDRYNLRQDAIDRLQIIGRTLMERGTVVISIDGHCDERGSSEYNMALGENRARAAKQWLVSYGIADTRLQTNSYGKERLAAYGCTDEACHQQNRRCEFSVISQ